MAIFAGNGAIFAGNGAIGNGFGGDSGCIFVDAGTTSVGDDICFAIVAGCFNYVMFISFSINYISRIIIFFQLNKHIKWLAFCFHFFFQAIKYI